MRRTQGSSKPSGYTYVRRSRGAPEGLRVDAKTGRVNDDASGCSERKKACAGASLDDLPGADQVDHLERDVSAEPTVTTSVEARRGTRGDFAP